MRKPVAAVIHPGLPVDTGGAPRTMGRGVDIMYVVCDDGAVFARLLEEGTDWNVDQPIPGTPMAEAGYS